MKTPDWPTAADKLRRIERGDEPLDKTIREAFGEWKAQLSVEESTRRKYVRAVGQLVDFLHSRKVVLLGQIRPSDMQALRVSRKVSKGTLTREIQSWRLFFGWCMAEGRGWLKKNPGKWVAVTKQIKQRPIQPYTQEEISSIIASCDLIGRGSYERVRARALILTLRYTGLRISDALHLSRDSIRDGQLCVYTQKEGKQVWLPVHPDLAQVLELLPLPRGAEAGCRYYFWNGSSNRRAILGMGERTLHRVCQLSGVAHAHAHRFRHSLAIDILTAGGTLTDVADALGNTEAIVAKHYAPWCTARQDRIREVVLRAFDRGTQSHPSHSTKSRRVN